MSDDVIRELERKLAASSDPSDRLLLAHRLTLAGRRHDALDVLVAGMDDRGVRAEVAKWPAWSHTEGPGRTRCVDARPIVIAPELRWATLIRLHPDALGSLLVSPLGVVAQSHRSLGILDPATGTVRAAIAAWNGDAASLAGEVVYAGGIYHYDTERDGPNGLQARELHTGKLLGHLEDGPPTPAILVAHGPRRVLSWFWGGRKDRFQSVAHDEDGLRPMESSEAPTWCRLADREVWLAVQPDGRIDWLDCEGHDLGLAADSRDMITVTRSERGCVVARHEFVRAPTPGGTVEATKRWEYQTEAGPGVTLTPTRVVLTHGTSHEPGRTLLFDRATGTPCGELRWGVTAASPGVLYLAHDDELCAYDDDARLLWSLELPPPLFRVERLACAAGMLVGMTADGVAFGVALRPKNASPPPPTAAEVAPPPSTFKALREQLCPIVSSGIEAVHGIVEPHTDGSLDHLVIKLPKATPRSARLMKSLEQWTAARHVVGHKRLILEVRSAEVPRLRVSAP